jgi:hypothetical protein
VRHLGSSLLLSILVGSSAHAIATYQYTGNPFSDFQPPYSAANFVTVTMTLAEPLGPNLPCCASAPPSVLSLSISDGLHTLDLNTPNLDPARVFAGFGTDAEGTIIGWSVFLGLFDQSFITTFSFDFIQPLNAQDVSAIPPGQGAVNSAPGSWSLVPEPSTGLLVFCGLLGLSGRCRARA